MNNIMGTVTEFAKTHTKLFYLILGGLLLLAIGYGFGRYGLPAKVVEKEKVVTQVQEHVVYRDRVVENKDVKQQEHVHRHVVTTTTKKPDGTLTTTKTEDDNADDTKDSQDVRVEYRDRVVEKLVQQTITKEKLTLRQPRWDIHAGLGVNVAHLFGQPEVGVPGMRGLVVEAGADVRVVGPFWAGVWGTTQGAAGLDLRLSF